VAYYKRSTPISDPSAYYPPNTTLAALFNSGLRNDSGEIVNSATAASVPTYHGLVGFIGDVLASSCCPVFRKIDQFSREIDDEHYAYDLLNSQANPGLSSFDARRKIIIDCINHGRGVAWIEKNEMGDPIGWWPIEPWECLELVEYDGLKEFTIEYLLTKNGIQHTVPASDVIDVQYPNIGGGRTVGLVAQLRNVLAKAQSEIKHGCLYFKHGSTVNRYLKVPGWPVGKQLDEMKQMLAEVGTGIDNAHKVGLLFGGAEMQAIQTQNDNAQFIESMQESSRSICAALRAPASFACLTGNNSYSSLEQENLALLGRCLSPWARSLEAQYNLKLIKPTLRRTRFVEHDQQDFLDYITRKQQIEKEFNSGGISIKERRQAINRSVDIDPKDFVMPTTVQSLAKLLREAEPPAPPPAPVIMPQNAQDKAQNGMEADPNTEQPPENTPINRLVMSNGKH
jgi:HK97 family phage portal protein